jgi:hypothetical protein
VHWIWDPGVAKLGQSVETQSQLARVSTEQMCDFHVVHIGLRIIAFDGVLHGDIWRRDSLWGGRR